MANVKVEQNTAGDYALGIEVEGTFVKIAEIPAARVQHQLERRQNLEQRADSGDKTAEEALAADYAAPKGDTTDEKPAKAAK